MCPATGSKMPIMFHPHATNKEAGGQEVPAKDWKRIIDS
jgi:hypothetical protein